MRDEPLYFSGGRKYRRDGSFDHEVYLEGDEEYGTNKALFYQDKIVYPCRITKADGDRNLPLTEGQLPYFRALNSLWLSTRDSLESVEYEAGYMGSGAVMTHYPAGGGPRVLAKRDDLFKRYGSNEKWDSLWDELRSKRSSRYLKRPRKATLDGAEVSLLGYGFTRGKRSEVVYGMPGYRVELSRNRIGYQQLDENGKDTEVCGMMGTGDLEILEGFIDVWTDWKRRLAVEGP